MTSVVMACLHPFSSLTAFSLILSEKKENREQQSKKDKKFLIVLA